MAEKIHHMTIKAKAFASIKVRIFLELFGSLPASR
jgi:hypothetical protein